MNNSAYYTHHRKLKKIITWTVLISKELFDACWNIYGFMLYFSKKANGCSDENPGWMVLMCIFIFMGALKLLFIAACFGVGFVSIILGKLRR